MAKGGRVRSGNQQFISHVLRWEGQASGQGKAIILSQMTTTLASIVRMDRSVLPIVQAVLNYAKMLGLQYGVPFEDALVMHTVGNIIP